MNLNETTVTGGFLWYKRNMIYFHGIQLYFPLKLHSEQITDVFNLHVSNFFKLLFIKKKPPANLYYLLQPVSAMSSLHIQFKVQLKPE